MDVDVPRDVAQEAIAMADHHNVAMENALAGLTHFDPTATVAPAGHTPRKRPHADGGPREGFLLAGEW